MYVQIAWLNPTTWANILVVFCLPFFIINCLQLRKRQKIALCGVFSLGLVTIVTSLSRFIVYAATENSVDDASGSKCCPSFSPYFITCTSGT
jgi:hypothetical protein